MAIQLLDQHLINKIAAGEVVERPASVVKELIENSLDAEATSIEVEIEEGGLSLIRITDNGKGMNPEDAEMSLQRHATSKIASLKDLESIATLGFRGEALAAISSVSKFKLRTMEPGAVSATEVISEQDDIQVKQASGVQGTMIEIRGLFHSVPARKKFMKSAQTEFRHILSIVLNQALLSPSVAWKLSHNGKDILQCDIVSDWKQRVVDLLGKEITDKMVEVSHQAGGIAISGFVLHPAKARERMKEQYLFVNQRAISDHMVAKAIKDAFHNHIPHNTKPGYVLQISLPHDLVDVNVHPRKSEVKFAEPQAVFRAVLFAVKQALTKVVGEGVQAKSDLFARPSKQYNLQSNSGSPSPRPAIPSFSQPKVSTKHASFDYQRDLIKRSNPIQAKQETTTFSAPSMQKENVLSQKGWVLLGQAHNAYLIVQTEQAILFVDQHAVAEKILFEDMMKHLDEPKIQSLLLPVLLELSHEQIALIQENNEALLSLGIEGELFGGTTYKVSGIPQNVKTNDVKTFILGVLDDLSQEHFDSSLSLKKRQEELAKMASCRGAVKFGDSLSHEEQMKLLTDLIEKEITACCHGRPVLFEIDTDKLNKEFCRP